MRLLKNKMVGICLNKEGFAGFRVARILRARFDRKDKQIVMLVVRCFGGDAVENDGYNGRIFKLIERKEFVGPCRGVIDGKEYLPIDDYAIGLYATRHQQADEDQEHLVPADEAIGIPVLGEHAGNLHLEKTEIQQLKELLRTHPGMLKQQLPNEPFWTLKLPDKSVVELFGYGYASKGRPVKAEILLITAWTTADKTPVTYGGSTIPHSRLAKGLRALLKKYAKPEPRARKPVDVPAEHPAQADTPLDEVLNRNDYF